MHMLICDLPACWGPIEPYHDQVIVDVLSPQGDHTLHYHAECMPTVSIPQPGVHVRVSRPPLHPMCRTARPGRLSVVPGPQTRPETEAETETIPAVDLDAAG